MLSRRSFLKGSMLLGGALMLDGFVVEPRMIDIVETTIRVKGLPDEFNGLRICQITDVHHGRHISIEYIRGIVEEAGRLDPDLIVLTGDYIDKDKSYTAPVIEALSSFKTRFGTIAILGNHDHYVGRKHIEDVIRSHNIPLLRNAHTYMESGNSALCIAGVADFVEDEPDAKAALKGVDPEIPRILLSHHPDYAEYLPKGERIDLVISGHTHGGQVRLPFGIAPVLPSKFGQKYSGGLVSLQTGTQVYVSRGIGMSMIPVRFNCPPELTLIKLAA